MDDATEHLLSDLRRLARMEHSDLSVADDAASTIEQLEKEREVLEATIAMLAGLRKYAIIYAPDGTTRCWQAFWRDGEKLGIRSDSYRYAVARAEQLERLP